MHPIVLLLRYVWALPTTSIGLLVAFTALWRGHVAVVDGVLEVHGPIPAWLLRHMTLLAGGAAAITLGHVVVGQDAGSLDLTRAHERVHVRQCEAWGPLFVPAYLAASLWAAARGRDIYRGNPFEVEAFRSAGR